MNYNQECSRLLSELQNILPLVEDEWIKNNWSDFQKIYTLSCGDDRKKIKDTMNNFKKLLK